MKTYGLTIALTNTVTSQVKSFEVTMHEPISVRQGKILQIILELD